MHIKEIYLLKHLLNQDVYKRQDTFLAWTDDFNSRITSPNLPTGFVSMTDDFVDYSSLLFDYKQLPDGNIFPEVNCRFTSFLLMQDHIQMCIRDSVPPGQLLSK